MQLQGIPIYEILVKYEHVRIGLVAMEIIADAARLRAGWRDLSHEDTIQFLARFGLCDNRPDNCASRSSHWPAPISVDCCVENMNREIDCSDTARQPNAAPVSASNNCIV